MSSNDIFLPADTDDSAVTILKLNLESSIREYKRMLKNQSDIETTVCTFNHNQIVAKFDQICMLKRAILKLVDHRHLWVEI